MAEQMPMIQLGPHRVSRLIVGANPIIGCSYMGSLMGRFMSEYYTIDNINKLIVRCLEVGINTWQTSGHEKIDQALERLRGEGHDFHWIFLARGDEDAQTLAEIVRRNRPIAIAHHGGVTDRRYRDGQIRDVHDFMKRVRDAGVMAVVSAHNPVVIRFVEDEGWDVDFYMTCFYRLTRTPQELAADVGQQVPIWGEFLPGDPAKMVEVIRSVRKPCLAFKILAGGRRAERPEATEAAFEYAFRSIKPTDAVITGMFPCFRDEAEENAALTRRFSPLSE